MYLVDGVPTNMTEMPLDPSEIESVTIIKDIVAKAMYGTVGADGVILIKTYHGKLNERTVKVNVEKGTSIVDRMPTWANGAEYAQLNNLARSNSNLRDN
jgi:TonB-dependent SusC/RagA subfamily outer membrane receptor